MLWEQCSLQCISLSTSPLKAVRGFNQVTELSIGVRLHDSKIVSSYCVLVNSSGVPPTGCCEIAVESVQVFSSSNLSASGCDSCLWRRRLASSLAMALVIIVLITHSRTSRPHEGIERTCGHQSYASEFQRRCASAMALGYFSTLTATRRKIRRAQWASIGRHSQALVSCTGHSHATRLR